MSRRHPAAVLVDMGSSDVSALGKASAWAAISLDDDDEEEETEEAERAVAPAAVAASTAARGATAGPASSVFSAPPSASSASASSSASAAGSGGVSAPRQQQQQQRSPVALTLAQLCPADPASSKAELDSPAAIKEAAAGIIQVRAGESGCRYGRVRRCACCAVCVCILYRPPACPELASNSGDSGVRGRSAFMQMRE